MKRLAVFLGQLVTVILFASEPALPSALTVPQWVDISCTDAGCPLADSERPESVSMATVAGYPHLAFSSVDSDGERELHLLKLTRDGTWQRIDTDELDEDGFSEGLPALAEIGGKVAVAYAKSETSSGRTRPVMATLNGDGWQLQSPSRPYSSGVRAKKVSLGATSEKTYLIFDIYAEGFIPAHRSFVYDLSAGGCGFGCKDELSNYAAAETGGTLESTFTSHLGTPWAAWVVPYDIEEGMQYEVHTKRLDTDWGENKILNAESINARRPSLASAGGSLFLAFDELHNSLRRWHVRVKRLENAPSGRGSSPVWREPVAAPLNAYLSEDAYSSKIAEVNGTAYLTFLQKNGSRYELRAAYLARSPLGDEIWQHYLSPLNSSGTTVSQGPAIASYRDRPYVAFIENDAVRVVTLDSDGDGVTDSGDNCSDIPNGDQANLDGDGSGDLCDFDLDGDGTGNFGDNCPKHANASQADSDHDGTGDSCDISPLEVPVSAEGNRAEERRQVPIPPIVKGTYPTPSLSVKVKASRGKTRIRGRRVTVRPGRLQTSGRVGNLSDRGLAQLSVEVTGRARRGRHSRKVTIRRYPDPAGSGRFSSTIKLARGAYTITVRARDRSGKSRRKVYKLTVG